MLAELHDWASEIALVPNSGIQFVDFGFDLSAHRALKRTFIERPVERDGTRERRVMLRLPDIGPDGDLPQEFEMLPEDVELEVNSVRAMEMFLEKWVPVPFLRIADGSPLDATASFDEGPSNWARVRVVEIPEPLRRDGPSHRAVFAFDTSIEPVRPNRPYVAPCPDDVSAPVFFRLASALDKVAWFFCDTRSKESGVIGRWFQGWVDDWLMDLFREYYSSRNRGKALDEASMDVRLEHWMRYVAFLETLQAVITPPRTSFVDTITRRDGTTQPKTPPVDVDLVLDIGNSRTCGLLHETLPDQGAMRLEAIPILQLRDLGRPEHVYSDPFSSQIELSQARFGRADLSRRSARARAFHWPSLVRVGHEAQRLRSANDGAGPETGMSSPKRYLWDGDPVLTPWEFQPCDYPPEHTPPGIEVEARQILNPAGDPVIFKRRERARMDPALRAPAGELSFSRSSFFSLMLAEIVIQALTMVNAPGHRYRRKQKELPRRLRRIVLTVPPAMTLQEQQILHKRAEAALLLVWQLMRWHDEDGGKIDGDAACAHPDMPEIRLNLDEASCAHFVWLYGEIAQKFQGAADRFVDFAGRPRPLAEPEVEPPADAPMQPSVRVASIDVGGGTTDLMVTTYYLRDRRALSPVQNFREGFRLGGDDVLRRVVEEMILPAVERAAKETGAINPRKLLIERFGGNDHDMSVQDQQRRRHFSDRLLYSIAVAILGQHEAQPPYTDDEVKSLTFLQLLGETAKVRVAAGERAVAQEVLDYLERPLRQAGAKDFRFEDVPLPLDFRLLRGIVDRTLGDVARQLAEVVAAFDVDVLLLSGRPTRLPAMTEMFRECFPVSPDLVVPLGEYRAHEWFPFRDDDNVRIADPKTCTAVGALLCVMSDGQIENFTLLAEKLSMRSTARFIGQIEQNGQIRKTDVYFHNVDLDTARAGEADQKDIPTVITPIRIGFRQLDLERWVATPLYKLDFRMTPAQIVERRPFKLTLERTDFEPDDDVTDPDEIMRLQAGREAFKIAFAEDAKGEPRDPRKDFSLKLCTLLNDDRYWLDTGVFKLN